MELVDQRAPGLRADDDGGTELPLPDQAQVIGYARDMTTGALTLIGNTSTANSDAQAVAIVR